MDIRLLLMEQTGQELLVDTRYDDQTQRIFVRAVTMDGQLHEDNFRLATNTQWAIKESLKRLAEQIRTAAVYRKALVDKRQAERVIEETRANHPRAAEIVDKSLK